MRSFYIAPTGLHPGRLLEAFPDASVFVPEEAALLKGPALIWLLLSEPKDLEAVLQCQSLPVPPRLIVLSNEPAAAQALEVFKAGVHGYCHAYAAVGLLKQAATVVSNGGIWVGPEFMPYLLRGVDSLLGAVKKRDETAAKEEDFDISVLTAREREVVEQVCEGLSNKEIARRLDITERTVKAHTGAVFEKLGFRDRVQLIIHLKPRLFPDNKH